MHVVLDEFTPNIPAQFNLNGFPLGNRIRIVGVPNVNADRFSIDLKTDLYGDVAFHFNPRFNESCVVRNHTNGGQWNHEERSGGFPFNIGEIFTIDIVNNNGQILVQVNGNGFTNFLERVPSCAQASTLVIDGDVSIHSVQTVVSIDESAAKIVNQLSKMEDPFDFDEPKYMPSLSKEESEKPSSGIEILSSSSGPSTSLFPLFARPSLPNTPSGSLSPTLLELMHQVASLKEDIKPPNIILEEFNPAIVAEFNIYGFPYGRRIRIVGVPNMNAERFEINLKTQDNIFFHFNPRFKENCVVRNHTKAGRWQKEARAGGLPFNVGEVFTVEFVSLNGLIKVLVNGKDFVSFTERAPSYTTAVTLVIDGDVSIHSLQMAERMITLTSSDNKTYEASYDMMVKLSKTISDLIVNCVSDAGDGTLTIPILNVDGATLEKVIEWCKHHKDDAPPTEEEKEEQKEKRTDDIDEWDQNFMKVEYQVMYDLIMAANYLDIRALLDLGCKTVAGMMKGCSSEELRRKFNIKSDFTKEEEEQIKKENAWCED